MIQNKKKVSRSGHAASVKLSVMLLNNITLKWSQDRIALIVKVVVIPAHPWWMQCDAMQSTSTGRGRGRELCGEIFPAIFLSTPNGWMVNAGMKRESVYPTTVQRPCRLAA